MAKNHLKLVGVEQSCDRRFLYLQIEDEQGRFFLRRISKTEAFGNSAALQSLKDLECLPCVRCVHAILCEEGFVDGCEIGGCEVLKCPKY